MPPLYGRAVRLYPLAQWHQHIEKSASSRVPAPALGGGWRVIVRNDDHNTFDHVARTLARYIPGITLDRGHEIANVIHNTGRAIVFSGHQELAEHYWEQLKLSGPDDGPARAGLSAAAP